MLLSTVSHRVFRSIHLPSSVIQSRLLSSSWISDYHLEKDDVKRRQRLVNEVLPSLDSGDSSKDKDYTAHLHKDLTRQRGALQTSLSIRDDISSLLQNSSKSEPKVPIGNEVKTQLKLLDRSIQQYLSYIFNLDDLKLERISFDHSPALVLEKIAKGESVHRIRSLSELKRRLTNGRRCFALFHPSLPAEPLVFIHVGLTTELVGSLAALETSKSEEAPNSAIFYSVNSPLSALRGLDIASLLIKEVVHCLQEHFPTIKTFSTLSPIPKFNQWLFTKIENDEKIPIPIQHIKNINEALYLNYPNLPSENLDTLKQLRLMLQDQNYEWARNPQILELLKEPMRWLGAYYILQEKAGAGHQKLPLDDVARFHLRNGAIFHAINWQANPSAQGLQSSSSLMINYLYDLEALPSNVHNFPAADQPLPRSKAIDNLLGQL